ncbi:MAG TPA: SPFH domain-containing protein [Chloroflexota bacterium]|nr:SPFH domain-containing protein [Chloroflexota bacterium]
MAVQTIIIIAILVVGTILAISVLGSLYRKVGPNRALIVYGRGGTKVLVGGGTVVVPLFQKADEFNLELMSFDVAPNYLLYTNQGIPVKVEAITQLKVENEDEKIKRAANQFLSKTEDDREMMVRQVMEGHLRGIVGQLTVEQLVKDPEMVSARMRETVAADLDKLGLEVVSFTLKDVADESGYIENMSRPEIARNKQMAEIAEAEASRNVTMRQAETQRESAQAKAKADQDRVLAETLSKAKQAEAERDLEVKQAEYAATISQQKAQADRAYDIQSSITQQRLVEETTKVSLIQKQQEVKVQQAEAERRAAELLATMQRQAEADSERIRILAEAEQRRAVIEAEGRAKAVRQQAEAEAAAIRARGEAEADALKMKGLAEAEALRAKGLAEAEARQKQVEALNVQGQAAIVDSALKVLPQVAASLFEAYGRIGNVTYVASGAQGEGVTSRITQEVVGMVPLLGAVFESTTGMKLHDLVAGQLARNGATDAQAGGATPAAAAAPEPAPDQVSQVVSPSAPDISVTVPLTGNGTGQEKAG